MTIINTATTINNRMTAALMQFERVSAEVL